MTADTFRSITFAFLLVLSVVAVATPATAATNTTVSVDPGTQSVETGETVQYDVVVDSVDNGVAAYEFEATVGDAGTAEITAASPVGTTESDSLTEVDVASDGSSVTVATSEGGHDDGVVATITVEGVAAGSTDLSLSDVVVGDGDSNSYSIDGTTAGTVDVTAGDGEPTPTPTPPADNQRGDAGTWDSSTGSGEVGPDAPVFRGEDAGDITFVDANGQTVPGAVLQNTDGRTLVSIGDDQPITTYTDGDTTVYVSEPEIGDYEFRLGSTGGDVAGGTVPASEDSLTVWADYDYGSAEDLEITVHEDGDLDATDEVVDDRTREADADGQVTFDLDLGDLDSTEYEVTLEGVDDLTGDEASVTDNFTISGADDVTLDLDESEVVKGENVRFDLHGGLEANYHVVSVDANDADGDEGEIFRHVGDTVAVGDARAVVEIDGGVGTGSIDTTHLSDTDVDVRVSNPVSEFDEDWVPNDGLSALDTGADAYDRSVSDSALTVTEGDVTLENPTDFYVPGADVTVNGTVADAYDEVHLFARDQGDFERVDVDGMSVSDGEFEAEDVDLTDGDGDGNALLNLPGTYRLAAVAGEAGDAETLTTSEVVQNVSARVTLRVTDAEFEANATIVNGEVPVHDGIDITGVARGSDAVSVTLFGPRGKVALAAGADGISVDSDGTFEAEDVPVRTGTLFDQTISKGTVYMNVGSTGRDGVRGDGSHDTLEFAQLIRDINEGTFTQGQAIERLRAETSGDTGSDDHGAIFQFRLTDPRTTLDTVVGEAGVDGTVEVGSEMAVEGTTNRQPELNVITAEVIEGPSRQDFPIVTTEEWGTDGEWTATMNTSGLEPGTYTVEASDGDSSDVMEFRLAESVGTDEETSTATATDAETDTGAGSGLENSTNGTETETDSLGQEGPGFGVAVALVALLTVGLLAVRSTA